MSIIQISKIQQRSGNIVDLPQLDEAEFGWASDTKQLFIGKTTPNENIEVLTSYSQINFDQINGTVGNINVTPSTLTNGQVLAYDGDNWVNRGGNAGGLINLGEVSNVKISGGAIGYVLETDGLGNLSWTPKSSIISFIQNVTKASPAVITTTQDTFLTDGLRVTITDAQGMTQLNGNSYYVDVLTSNTVALYANADLTGPINSTGFSTYAFTSAASTTASTNRVTVGNSALFDLNQEVLFLGGLSTSGLENNFSYYIKAKPSGTAITVSEELLANGEAGNVKTLSTATLTSANVYAAGGRIIATVSGGGGSATGAAGSEGAIQFYGSGILAADADLNWNTSAPKTLTAIGNINTVNVNATGVVTSPQLISNIATGTAPLTVTSTTRVANLSVNYANVSDFGVVTNQTTGTFFPVFVNSSATGNRALGANANVSFNAATGALISTLYTGTLTTEAQPNVTSVGTLTSLGVSGNITAANITANTGVFTGNASGLSEINASNLSSGTVPTARLSGSYPIAVTSATTAGTVTTAAQPNITSVGTLTSLSVTGTTTSGNLSTGGTLSVTGNANVGNLGTAGLITATGNVSGGNLTTAGVVTATGNVSGGNLTTAGALNVTGNANVGNLGTARVIATADVIAPQLTSNIATGTAPLVVTSTTVVPNLYVARANVADFISVASGTGNNFLIFANAATGNVTEVTSTGLTANLSNNSITATTFVGALSGAATSAATAGTVTTAAQPNITSVGTLTSLIVSGATSVTGNSALTTTNITSGANTITGYITGNWTLTAGSRMEATYADLAEYYEADERYLPGTVLMFGGEKEVTLADDGTSKVAGVVSTNPAYVMNSTCPGLLTAVALQGRVPCKVRGKISKGDMLISGGNGFARPNQFPSMGTVIGKALEDFDGYEGVIEVAVGRL